MPNQTPPPPPAAPPLPPLTLVCVVALAFAAQAPLQGLDLEARGGALFFDPGSETAAADFSARPLANLTAEHSFIKTFAAEADALTSPLMTRRLSARACFKPSAWGILFKAGFGPAFWLIPAAEKDSSRSGISPGFSVTLEGVMPGLAFARFRSDLGFTSVLRGDLTDNISASASALEGALGFWLPRRVILGAKASLDSLDQSVSLSAYQSTALVRAALFVEIFDKTSPVLIKAAAGYAALGYQVTGRAPAAPYRMNALYLGADISLRVYRTMRLLAGVESTVLAAVEGSTGAAPLLLTAYTGLSWSVEKPW